MRLSSQGLFEINSVNMGFPDSSVGKEPTCNAGDPGSIPGSGRSAGEGKGYPLQCSGEVHGLYSGTYIHIVQLSPSSIS